SRRRHTRSKRDWSSDVCSSDLDQSGSAARAKQGGQQCVSVLVEVVARFVEDEPGLARQGRSGESDPGGLSSGEAAQPSVEVIELEVQSEIGGGGQCAFFDVPVIADAVEVGVIGVTVQRALQGVTDIGDAEGRIDALRRMRQELIDVDGTVGAGGGSGSGGQES